MRAARRTREVTRAGHDPALAGTPRIRQQSGGHTSGAVRNGAYRISDAPGEQRSSLLQPCGGKAAAASSATIASVVAPASGPATTSATLRFGSFVSAHECFATHALGSGWTARPRYSFSNEAATTSAWLVQTIWRLSSGLVCRYWPVPRDVLVGFVSRAGGTPRGAHNRIGGTSHGEG
jgi:hypothetical protein